MDIISLKQAPIQYFLKLATFSGDEISMKHPQKTILNYLFSLIHPLSLATVSNVLIINKMESNTQITVQRGDKTVQLPTDKEWTLGGLRDELSKQFQVAKEELGHLTSTIDHEVHFITSEFSLKKAVSVVDKAKLVILSSSDDLAKDLQTVKDVMAKKIAELPKLDLDIKIPKFLEETKTAITELASELDHKLIDEIHSFIPERHAPSENPIGSFLIGCYLRQAKNQGTKFQDIDKSIFALDSWRESKREKANLGDKTLPVPILTLPPNLSQKAPFSLKNSYLFSDVEPQQVKTSQYQGGNKLAKEHTSFIQCFAEHAKLFILDGIHYAMTLASSHLLNLDILQKIFNIRRFSDFDIRFAIMVIKVWIQYGILDKLVYQQPTNSNDGVLADFDDNEIVGILGDWGTNLQDAFDIMDELVLNRGVTVLLHDGDVYYAGLPEEFSPIAQHLTELRKKVPNLRYYAIPGNHDYYTFGGPFYKSLPTNNDPKRSQFTQTASFFCIKNKSSTVQFIGLNTGRYDHEFINVLNHWWEGVQVDPEEVAWAIEKINHFTGKTFLISHHPYFSTFEKTIGQSTQMGHKNCNVNPTLARQFFQVLPKITCWMWGHQHRFSTFAQGAFGVNRSVLIGNSSYQNNQEGYYKANFPSGGVTVTDFHPEYGTSPTDKGWLNHTAIVLGNVTEPTISADYVYMTASYTKKSLVLKTLKDSFSPPECTTVFLNQPYKLLADNGLSLAVNDHVWLDSTPTSIEFINPTDPQSNGAVQFNQELLIRVASTENYLSFDGQQVGFGQNNGTQAFRFKLQGDTGSITTQDLFTLLALQGNTAVGAAYSSESEEYRLKVVQGSRFLVYNVHKN